MVNWFGRVAIGSSTSIAGSEGRSKWQGFNPFALPPLHLDVQVPRAHDSMDGGGRTAAGTAVEDVRERPSMGADVRAILSGRAINQ